MQTQIYVFIIFRKNMFFNVQKYLTVYSLKMMFYIIACCFSLGLTQLVQKETKNGEYSSLYQQTRTVPRYYLCGVSIAYKQEYRQPPQVCSVRCQKVRRAVRPGKKCHWYTHCDIPPRVLQWKRINGIKFKMCHFQNWQDQQQFTNHGDWNWQSFKMCPKDQYIDGFTAKTSERDGFSGLKINCRQMYNSKQFSADTVFDGDGQWESSSLKDSFGTGFKVKKHSGYITGLGIQFVKAPLITNVTFDYLIPKDYKVIPETIDKATVLNYGIVSMTKTIQFRKQKQYQRIRQNQNGVMHKQQLSKYLSHTWGISTQHKIFGVKINSDYKLQTSTTSTNSVEKFENLKFGTVQLFKVGRIQKDQIEVPSCMKYVISQIVYKSTTDVPYILYIQYSNGFATQTDPIKGILRGTVVGETETKIQSYKIC